MTEGLHGVEWGGAEWSGAGRGGVEVEQRSRSAAGDDCYSLVHILSNSSSSSERLSSLIFLSANQALTTVLCTLGWQPCHIEARTPGNRGPTSATTEAALPKKTQDFAPQSVSNREFTRSILLLSSAAPTRELLLLTLLLTWCKDCP